MQKQITSVLGSLGFESREIKIYLALLKGARLTALQISKEANIDRTTTYDILEKLTNKGIVSTITLNKTKHFECLNPEKLLSFFGEKYSSLKSILPSLNQIKNENPEQVSSQLFQGVNGLKTVILDLIEAKTNYRMIGFKKEYEEILKYFFDQGIIKTEISNIKEYAIVSPKEKFRKLKTGKYRYLNLDSSMTTLLYKDTTVFFIWTKPYFAIRIENKTISKAQEEYFNLLWNVAKK